jgi:hypothetical protein
MLRTPIAILSILALACCDSKESEPIVILEAAINRSYTVKGINGYRVSGILKNEGSDTIAFPVLRVELPNVDDSLMYSVAGCIIPPGESRYFLTGGHNISTFEAPVEVDYLYSDKRIEKAYIERQLSFLPKLSCTDISFESWDNGRGGELRYRFVNESGLDLERIQAIAVFFDNEGTLLASRAFHSTKLDHPESKHIVLDIENGNEVVRTEIQIDAFLERNEIPNPRISTPPSIE